jgi:hypothetical protein
MANAITLTSGMRKNLFSLQNTEKLLQTTQTRLATGLRVQRPLMIPSTTLPLWSIANVPTTCLPEKTKCQNRSSWSTPPTMVLNPSML